MQDAINTGFLVIPAHDAGIQNSLLFLVQESWTPAFAGVTNRFASASSLSDLTVRQAAKRKTAPFFCEQCLVSQPFHLGQHARTTFRRFFDDIFEFFPGAVLPKELVGRKSDKLLEAS